MIRTLLYNDIVTVVLCFCLLLIALTRFTEAKRLHAYLELLYSTKYVKRYGKDIKFFDAFNVVFYIVFVLSITVLCYPYINTQLPDFSILYRYLLIFAGLFVFFGLKFLVELLIAKIFNIESVIKRYLFKKYSYRHFTVVFLLPILAVLTYHNYYHETATLYVLFFVFGVHLINYFFVVKSFFILLRQNIFYFILYLCTLEIAPYVLLYKYLG